MVERRGGRARLGRGWLALALLLAPALAETQEDPPEVELPPGISALPELVASVPASFPPQALEEGVQADVLLQISIDETGRITDSVPTSIILYTAGSDGTLVETPLPPEQDPYGFVPAAQQALTEFRFTPALDDAGQPIAVALVWRQSFYFEEETTEVPLEGTGESTEVGEGTGQEPALVNLRGTLLERGTRAPLIGADVTAVQGDVSWTASSDAGGVFELRDLGPGTWRLQVDAPGYQLVSQDEEVVAGQRTEVTYYVERQSYGEYSYEVREQAVRREVSRQTLSMVEVTRIPGNNGDAIKVVQNLPGFARAPFNGGLVVIRGSAPEDSRIYVEGVWIPVIFHFGGLTSVINSDLLEEIEYLPGAFSVEYGRGHGGVINVETRAPQTDRYHGYADLDIFDAGLLVEGPIADDWSFFAAGRRSYIDAIIPAIIPDDAGLSLTVAPRYWDYQAKLQWDPSPRHSANLLLFGSDDALAFLVEEPPNDPTIRGNIDTSTQFHRARLEWSAELGDDVSNRAIASVGYQNLDFAAGEDLFFLLDSYPFALRDTLEWRPSDRLRLRPGLDFELNRFDLTLRAPRPSKEGEVPVNLGAAELIELTLNGDLIFEPATFLEAEWDVLDGLTLVPGVRQEYYSSVDAFAFDGRLSVRYDVTDALTLKAALGTFHEAPLPDETAEDFGNPDLGLEWAVHYVLGAEYDFNDTIDLDVQLFYKDLRDLVTRSDDTVVRDGESVPEIYNNDGRGRAYGAEVLLRHEVANGFFGWISYTLSRSERQDAPDEDYRLFSWDQTHILAVIASYELGSNWAVGARFRYVTGIPRTPIIGSVYDADTDIYVRVPGEPRSLRLDDFHQLDVRIDKRFVFDNWMLDLYLDVSNTYNRQNPEALDYNFDYSRQAVTTGLPIIPSFGLRGSF